jgi:hypothetical protein
MLKTLKTLVLKTAKVTSVKLLTPADRIGQGFDFAYPSPTDNLSHGHVPVPVPNNPEPEQVRSRQLSAMRMQQKLQQYQADGEVAAPTGLGRPGCIPGSSTGRFAASTATTLTTKRTSWRATRTTATVEGRANASHTSVVCHSSVTSRASFPSDLRNCRHDRIGCDCQSLRRLSGTNGKSEKRVVREISPIAAVGK